MPDYTMCTGDDCPLKRDCFRFIAKPDEYQSMFSIVPYNKEKKECNYYTKVHKLIHTDKGIKIPKK